MAFQTRSASPAVTPKFPLPVPVPLRPSFLHAAHNIYNEGAIAPGATTSQLFQRIPLLKFYRGFTVSIAGMVPYAGTAFLAWGYLRAHLLPDLDASGRRGSCSAIGSRDWCACGGDGSDGIVPVRNCATTHAGRWADGA
ncbi:hypothetical protein EW146_g3000 [Bondarzewia mesenterica]|uniref:Uncharacterized protein n=1 Tax=Bondarzewia mesenterica TaxID=1095465 RepID=A0A4S4M4V0_9AGAM|nr:hypothetical protein EW146_g3000 [Bondarzewia mesenterica]